MHIIKQLSMNIYALLHLNIRMMSQSLSNGPVKLIKRVKIVHSFLQSVSDQFHVIILSLPM